MIHRRIENLNIEEERSIISPDALKQEFPLVESDVQFIQQGQSAVKNILNRNDHRLMVIVGPCSIHDIEAAEEYAQKLKALSDRVNQHLFLIMRVYFEKPRTTVGWQGLINDPYMDQSFQIEDGLKLARALLLKVTRIGLPIATEALDIVTPPYIQDLVSYTAIGARTVESQSHRIMASGLTAAVGFKNGTNGDLDVAINAIRSTECCHNFISINQEGRASIIRTRGNPYGHMILRGGKKPNYEADDLENCAKRMNSTGLASNIVVDFSHGNSAKDPQRQFDVCINICEQIRSGNQNIRGVMIESHLKDGNQVIPNDLSQLEYGVSITDGCIGWSKTVQMIESLSEAAKTRFELSRNDHISKSKSQVSNPVIPE